MRPLPARRRLERGVTMLVVLVLVSVMLLGVMAFARMAEVGTLVSGNTVYREASIQASEIGLNTAYDRIRNDLPNEELAQGAWYWPSLQASNADGVPQVNFNAAPEIVTGAYSVRYVVERVCQGVLPVEDPLRQCLVRQLPQEDRSRSAGREAIDPPNSRQFRVTIRVIGPKGTETWVQSLITKG